MLLFFFVVHACGRDVPALARLDVVASRAREDARVTLAHDREGDMRASGVSSRTCVREARRERRGGGEERRRERARIELCISGQSTARAVRRHRARRRDATSRSMVVDASSSRARVDEGETDGAGCSMTQRDANDVGVLRARRRRDGAPIDRRSREERCDDHDGGGDREERTTDEDCVRVRGVRAVEQDGRSR